MSLDQYDFTYIIHSNRLYLQVKDYNNKTYYTSINTINKNRKLIKALLTKYTIKYTKTKYNTMDICINNIYINELMDNKSAYFCNDIVKKNDIYAIKYIINYNYIIIQLVDIKTHNCYSVEVNYINVAHLNDILFQLNHMPNSNGIIMNNNNNLILNMNTSNNAPTIYFNNILDNSKKYLLVWYHMTNPNKKEIKSNIPPEYNPADDINYIFDFNLSL
jgi:hypothetical protein